MGAKFNIEKFDGTGDFSGGLVKAQDFVHDKVIGQQVVPEEEVV
nr:hypothetical protein [Tanacetum cinerariifolium]